MPGPDDPRRPDSEAIVVDRIKPHERVETGPLGVPAPDVLAAPTAPVPDRKDDSRE